MNQGSDFAFGIVTTGGLPEPNIAAIMLFCIDAISFMPYIIMLPKVATELMRLMCSVH